MSNSFFDHPILNSPYDYPARYWELDDSGQPTQKIIERRRRAEFITPIPKPKKRKASATQQEFVFDEGKGLSTAAQQYDPTSITNELRRHVDQWRTLPHPNQWQVTPETARLLQHWRHHDFGSIRPFFCQVEAVETVIWLTEVAPQSGKAGKSLLEHLANANNDANPELMRLALKLATGAGKTTVMAMLIAWQTINARRRPQSRKFSRGFLVVAPGLTIKDRLRVLQSNDPDTYYASRELVPGDMLDDVNHAKIVITNYHAFKLRERVELSKGGRSLLQGRGEELNTLETEGQMLQRVMPGLMGLKNILVLNDEAHHCYREKPGAEDEEDLKGDDKKEAEKNNEAARLWISGLEAVNRKLGVARVIDLSATPFFLRGSGYAEGTLFPWTMSDFSLMDAIECGIVKLPRVPVADNIPGTEMPMFRNLWEHIRSKMPKKGRGKANALDPLSLPPQLQTALEALYGHYEKTYRLWEEAGIRVPPCFIIVCQNTAISKLVYDFISGFHRQNDDGSTTLENGRLALFRNFDEHGNPFPRPNTLLIDSEQLESGETLDDNFRNMAADEIERFRREIVERGGKLADELQKGKELDDVTLLREVMNTVGKHGQLGGSIRCVVSVSMLTEGWDANTVTHVLGVRAFGTQLLCEQVIGRALRRQSYDLNEEGLFNVEYADVLGIPFDFTAKPVVAPPQPPRETIQVKAMRPERDALEIRFPRVEGYRVELPEERLTAEFNEDSILELTPDLVGATETQNSGIIGEKADLNLVHTGDVRPSQVLYELTSHLVLNKWRDAGKDPKLHLFGQLKRIAKQWLDGYLVCKGGTYPAQLKYKMLADMACNRITAGITRAFVGQRPIKAVLDPYNPTGSTTHVNFTTSKRNRWQTDARRCHINWVIIDSDWEAEFCRVVESHPRVRAYVKNHNLGLEVPYRYGSETRKYLPDFVALVDDGHGDDDLLHLVVEIKGYRREDAKEKKATMETYWVPGVNHLGTHGRWAFAEFTEVYQWFLETARRERGFPLKSNTTTPALLTHLNLLDAGKPTNAAMLLFGTNPQRFHRTAETKCIHCHGTAYRRPFASLQVYGGDLFEQADQARDFVLAKINRAIGTRAASNIAPATYELPPDAIGEAIINAIAHRDYYSNASVEVRLFADRLEVWNPGGLPGSLTLEGLRHDHASIPNNPLVAESLYLTRYIERVGSGTQTMIDLCREAGLPEPDFELRQGFFVITLWRDWLTDEVLARLDLNERQRQAIAFVKAQGQITNRNLREQSGVTIRTASRDLEDLVRRGVLTKVGATGRSTFYVMARKLDMNRTNRT